MTESKPGPPTKFRDLEINQTFDFIGPSRFNSFFKRCVKVGKRKYNDEDGGQHTVGSVDADVFHVAPAPEKPA